MKEGALENMWRLNLDGIERLIEDPYENVSWELIFCKGAGPQRISHHTCGVYGDKMILVGGLQGDLNNQNLYLFEIMSSTWSLISNVSVS